MSWVVCRLVRVGRVVSWVVRRMVLVGWVVRRVVMRRPGRPMGRRMRGQMSRVVVRGLVGVVVLPRG